MKIRNNYTGIDEDLIRSHFPYAEEVIKPEIIEDSDPEMDRIEAVIIDEHGISRIEVVALCKIFNNLHWPGNFGFDIRGKHCLEKCFWVEKEYTPLCISCKYDVQEIYEN